jgi:hypothetical protein
MNCFSTGNVSARPDIFLGLRYDTSVSPNGSQAVSAVAAASGGNTVYTIASTTSAGNGGWIGLSFTAASFAHGANNGTFTCVASSTTTVTLNNASGVVDTTGTLTTTSYPNDSQFQFELVQNQQFATGIRHNAQGTVVSTSVTPTFGTWYRLDMSSTTAGSILLTLSNGSSQVSHTFTVATMTITGDGMTVGSAPFGVGTGSAASILQGSTGTGTTAATAGTNGVFPFAAGSSVVVTGFTGTEVSLNGTQTILGCNYNGLMFNTSTAATFTNVSQNGTFVGYPALQPFVSFGNDDTASPTANTLRFNVDFFAFTWNPNLGAGGTPNVNKARYW